MFDPYIDHFDEISILRQGISDTQFWLMEGQIPPTFSNLCNDTSEKTCIAESCIPELYIKIMPLYGQP